MPLPFGGDFPNGASQPIIQAVAGGFAGRGSRSIPLFQNSGNPETIA